MIYSELPVGSVFLFGKEIVNRYNYVLHRNEEREVYFKWIKTEQDGMAICVNNVGAIPFDHRRPSTGSNRYERDHGTKVYLHSSLHKYLNCADNSWTIVEEGDAIPCIQRDGFLSHFNDVERKCIVPHTVRTTVPAGYTKKFGTTIEQQALFSIPTKEQIGTVSTNGTLGVSCNYIYTWVIDADTMSLYSNRGYMGRRGADRSFNIAPLAKIKDDAPIDMTEDNQMIIRIPEPDFTGDILSILGFQIEAA